MRVLLFAGLAELLGQRALELPDDDASSGAPSAQPLTVAELEARVRAAQPALAGRSFRVAVNRRYATADETVQPGDEVALIPPVSGG